MMARTQKASSRYRLLKPVRAVMMIEHPGSSLRSPTETLVEIPANAVVQTEGTAAKSGLINVLWNRDAYSVFFGDLEENGELIE